MKTIVKTYRLPNALYELILSESEQTRTSEAEVVRLALRSHFEHRQESAQLEVMERRLIEAINKNGRQLDSLIRQVIALAQPL
jgi:hypothetical protein